MGSAQMLLVVSGLVILGLLSLLVLNSMNRNLDTNLNNQALLAGTGIGQSILEEATAKNFDENVITAPVMTVDSLTSPGALGPDSGEGAPTAFDDIDDYDEMRRTDTMSVFGVFTSTVRVYYVVNLQPDVVSSSRTFAKRIDVTVTNRYLQDTIRLFGVKAY